ncbi:MAG TPA: GNAT family N-acetyltransferase [Rhodanobacteraceae bacterium]
MPLTAPVPLSPAHDCTAFDCGDDGLNAWLRKRAQKNEAAHGSRCFVVCDDARVVGFYALAAGSVARERAPAAIRRNMPDPIPAVVLGRLAVDRALQGCGLGADLLHDAVFRALRAAQEIGARVMLCQALNERAKRFYLRNGFVESTFDALIVMLDLKQVARLMPGKSA